MEMMEMMEMMETNEIPVAPCGTHVVSISYRSAPWPSRDPDLLEHGTNLFLTRQFSFLRRRILCTVVNEQKVMMEMFKKQKRKNVKLP